MSGFLAGSPAASWAFDTFVWTAILIACVLVLRRPVARIFGPQMAYALWLLPLGRLLLPPITLPHWMAPQAASEVATGTSVVFYETAATSLPAAEAVTAAAPTFGVGDLAALVAALWLGGAAVFLWVRFRNYFRMREKLLADAVSMGEIGKIHLVETPAIDAPLAFGVRDKVIAFPPGFMAMADLEARNFAIEHEVAHHRGGDLFVNIIIQPLFALHWFNPLASAGWRAMRLDQEAACDARVVAGRDSQTRAAYGAVIAGFAAGPQMSLATPMACPVLGDKSIIQRLRSLTMSEKSPRRRWTGRALIAAGALALPLTASITYANSVAEDVVSAVPPAPQAPAAPGPFADVPAPPAPSAIAPPVPGAPLAPEPPEPPQPGQTQRIAVERIVVGPHGDAHGAKRKWRVLQHDVAGEEAEHAHKQGKHSKKITRKINVITTGEERSMEELEREMEALGVHMGELGEEIGRAASARNYSMIGHHAAIAGAKSGQTFAAIALRCQQQGEAREAECEAEFQNAALEVVRSVRESIAADTSLSNEIRAEVLSELDEEIAELSEG